MMFHAFITQGVLEQLVNCFNEAAKGTRFSFYKNHVFQIEAGRS